MPIEHPANRPKRVTPRCNTCGVILDKEYETCPVCGRPIEKLDRTVEEGHASDQLGQGSTKAKEIKVPEVLKKRIPEKYSYRTSWTMIVLTWTLLEFTVLLLFSASLSITDPLPLGNPNQSAADPTALSVYLLTVIVGITLYRLYKQDNRFRIARLILTIPFLIIGIMGPLLIVMFMFEGTVIYAFLFHKSTIKTFKETDPDFTEILL